MATLRGGPSSASSFFDNLDKKCATVANLNVKALSVCALFRTKEDVSPQLL